MSETKRGAILTGTARYGGEPVIEAWCDGVSVAARAGTGRLVGRIWVGGRDPRKVGLREVVRVARAARRRARA